MKRKRLVHDLIHDEQGNVIVTVALMMTVFVGMLALSIDVGSMYLWKQRAQSAADAGALSGAEVLVQGNQAAAQEAYQVAVINDPNASFTASADKNQLFVTVSGTQQVPLWFARIFGYSSVTVNVSSKAQVDTLTGGRYMVPIGVPNQQFTYGQQVYLSQGAGNGTSGNYGYLDLTGGGASGFLYNMEHGDPNVLSVNQQIPTETGVMTQDVKQGVEYRLNESAPSYCSSYDTAQSDCPRVMYLPVLNTTNLSGTSTVTVLGFAAFFVDGIQGSGGSQQIVGRFIRMIRPGDIPESSVTTGSTIGGTSPTNYGTYGVKLVKP